MPINTHDYLTKRGWKGKGTALKQGHVTRPIAVVQKKNLHGVGKDRDEAVPFWDNIFASAALNIASATPTPSNSGTSTPLPTIPSKIPSAQPVASTSTISAPKLSVSARARKESARLRLYAGFVRGEVLTGREKEEQLKKMNLLGNGNGNGSKATPAAPPFRIPATSPASSSSSSSPPQSSTMPPSDSPIPASLSTSKNNKSEKLALKLAKQQRKAVRVERRREKEERARKREEKRAAREAKSDEAKKGRSKESGVDGAQALPSKEDEAGRSVNPEVETVDAMSAAAAVNGSRKKRKRERTGEEDGRGKNAGAGLSGDADALDDRAIAKQAKKKRKQGV